jgi:hypothetical protein
LHRAALAIPMVLALGGLISKIYPRDGVAAMTLGITNRRILHMVSLLPDSFFATIAIAITTSQSGFREHYI